MGRSKKHSAISADHLFEGTVRLGDNALVLGHRLSEWSSHAPTLEEDIAMSNIALDYIGQARLLLTYAGEVEGRGRDEDQLAYMRDVLDFKNMLMLEQPNGDFAFTMTRLFVYANYMQLYFQAATASLDATLAAIAEKSLKEVTYHVRHAGEWVVRLGDGTEESHRRCQSALDALWPFTGELFAADEVESALIADGIVPDPAAFRPDWDNQIDAVLARATLSRPADTPMMRGGKQGEHSEYLGHLLAELQFLQRAYPGAQW